MADPVGDRVAASGRVGAFGIGGVEDLRRFYRPAAMAAAHYDWRTLPVSVKMIRALRDLALSLPHTAAPADTAVQYGMTLGLTLAANLLDDPALVLRGLFGEAKPEERDMPEETFEEPSMPE